MGDQNIQLGDDNGPSPDDYRSMIADLDMDRRCPDMTDAEIDAMAAVYGQ
ncbi:hypothetical protein [Methylorubrum sp. SB2]